MMDMDPRDRELLDLDNALSDAHASRLAWAWRWYSAAVVAMVFLTLVSAVASVATVAAIFMEEWAVAIVALHFLIPSIPLGVGSVALVEWRRRRWVELEEW